MKRILLALGVAGILIVSLSACSKKTNQNTAVNNVKAQPKQTVDGFGVVKATDIENINIDFPALVDKVNVVEGQKVKNQDSLVTLNFNEFESQIRSKELSLSSEQNDIEKIQNDYIKSSNAPDMQKLLSDLQSAQNLYGQDQSEYAKQEVLYNSGSISKNDLDQAKKTLDEKKKDVDDIKFSIDSLKYDKQQSIDSMASDSSVLKSDLTAMKDKLNKPYIKGNDIICNVNNGVVYNIGYVPGDIVSSQKIILSIMNLDSLIVKANIPEEFIKSVKMGADVAVIPEADKSKTFKGKVIKISDMAVVNNGETDVPVDISVENSKGFLLPEFNVDVKINK